VKSEQEAEEKKEKKKIDRFNKKRQREEEMISIEEDTNNIFMEDLKPKERREPRKKLKGKRTSLKPKETGMEGVEKNNYIYYTRFRRQYEDSSTRTETTFIHASKEETKGS